MGSREELLQHFKEIVASRGDARAIVSDGGHVTFAGLADQVSAYRKMLRLSLDNEPALVGHAVANGADAVAVELAAWAEGHVSVALPRNVPAREAAHMIAVATPDLVVVDRAAEGSIWVEMVPENCTMLSDDLASTRPPVRSGPRFQFPQPDLVQLQFTSGSTGRPKAVALDAAAVHAALTDATGWYSEFPSAPVFSALPQHHAMGRAVALETLWSGRTVVFNERKTWGEQLSRLTCEQCATLICNPTFARFGVALGFWKKTPNIRRIVLGSASVETDLVSDLQAQLPDVAIDIRYGVSECFGAISVRRVAARAAPPVTGDVGRPMPSVEVHATSLCAPLRVRGRATAAFRLDVDGIANLRDASGFVSTGDLGSMDAGGNLVLSGRTNLSISHRGYRIDPVEIESVIKSAPSVVDAVVVGIPDQLVGEKIVAVVVGLKEGEISAADLKHHCRSNLSDYKVPEAVMELQSIPYKTSGKPDREAAREEVLRGL